MATGLAARRQPVRGSGAHSPALSLRPPDYWTIRPQGRSLPPARSWWATSSDDAFRAAYAQEVERLRRIVLWSSDEEGRCRDRLLAQDDEVRRAQKRRLDPARLTMRRERS